jgi:hypothetical protein
MRRDIVQFGGVDEAGFLAFWWATEVKSTLTSKNPQEFIEQEGCTPPEYPTQPNDWWDAKTPLLSEIAVPMLVCASFSDHGLHSTGSFRGWMQAKSKDKWLYTHRWGKWDSFYSDEVQQLTLKFFDHYVKGVQSNWNGPWNDAGRVRLEVRSSRDKVKEVRYEQTWPLPDAQYHRLYLSKDLALTDDLPELGSSESDLESGSDSDGSYMTYSGKGGSLSFKYTFTKATEVTGYVKLHLAVSVEGSDDMAIFAAIKKFDKKGKFVPFYGSTGLKEDAVTRGQLLVSMRALDEKQSTYYLPVISYQKQPLEEDEIVECDIPMEPSSTFFEPGESIELTVSSKEIVITGPYVKSCMGNKGTHAVHIGHSFIELPEIQR